MGLALWDGKAAKIFGLAKSQNAEQHQPHNAAVLKSFYIAESLFAQSRTSALFSSGSSWKEDTRS